MGTTVQIELSNGQTVTYTNEQVVSAHTIEQHNPLSIEMPIGTLDVTVYSENDDFNFLNPNSLTQYMKKGQKVTVTYTWNDNVTKQIGVYYIEELHNLEDNQLQIIASDVLGLLDNHIVVENYNKQMGKIYTPITDLFRFSGYTGQIEADGANASAGLWAYDGTFTEYTPIVSAKEILMQLLPAINCNIFVKRNGNPFIFDNDGGALFPGYGENRPQTSKNILKDRILSASSQYEMAMPIKSAKFEYCTVVAGKLEEIYNKNITGNTTIELNFNENYSNYTITNGTIISSNRNYIKFKSNSGSSVNVIIKARIQEDKIGVIEKTYLPNTKDGSDLYFQNNVIDHVYTSSTGYWANKYNDSFVIELSMIIDSDLNESVGYRTKVELYQDNLYNGVITDIDLDITGGMLATVKVLCDFNGYTPSN